MNDSAVRQLPEQEERMSERMREATAAANVQLRRDLNDLAVRQIAQSDPVPNLTAVVGQTAAEARDKITSLTATLRALDKLIETLKEHNITVDVDLGPIGNAAAAARRDLEKDRGNPPFVMPTV